MKKIKWLLFLLAFSVTLHGQRRSDYGAFAGVSSYLGDINPNRLLYSPMPAAGFFYRFNLHPRQAIRTSFFSGKLSANDLDFKNDFQLEREANFSGSVNEWAVQFEFNFFAYATDGKRWNYTPYIAAGAGLVFINTKSFKYVLATQPGEDKVPVSSGASTYVPAIPFTLGFKINVHKNLGIEAEYGFRKTFYDNFDGLKDLVDPADYGWIHNNDWYSFAGVSVTWKIYNKLAGCPAYNDVDSKRKR